MVPEPRVGRRRSTTPDHITDVAIELFAARGFDDVSVDDVAQAAGIARRTLFRYYASKNAIPWGDFDTHLEHLRDLLDNVDPRVPLGEALRAALLAFNTFDECRDRPAPPAHAGHPANRRTAGLFDDDVRRLARGDRRVRGAAARAPSRPTWCPRPSRGRCSGSRCRPTSTGWATNPSRCRTHSATRSTLSAPGLNGSNHDAKHVEHLVHTLRAQGQFCAASGSPMYGELFELVAADVEAGGVFATILSGHEDDPSRARGAASAARRTAPVGARRPGTGIAPLVSQHRGQLGRRGRVARDPARRGRTPRLRCARRWINHRRPTRWADPPR